MRPALDVLGLYNQASEEILVATCAQESLGGTFISQKDGPAKGIYQMEPKTHDDLWNTILVRNQTVRWQIMKALNTATNPRADRMVWDLQYATFMARAFYMRVTEALPEANDIEAIWEYYKMYWNTNLGAAKKTEFIANYNRFIKGPVLKPKSKIEDAIGEA